MDAVLPHRASVITVLNLKGGVGKTHAVWLLASVCQEQSLRLLACDTDTQANFSTSFLPDPQAGKGMDLLFNPGAEIESHTLVRRSAYSHIDIIPPGTSLPRFDLTNQAEWEKADLHLSLVDAIEQLRASYDFILFDCPPRLSLVSFTALCASDHVIIPLEAADWGAQGIMQVTAAIRYVQQHFFVDRGQKEGHFRGLRGGQGGLPGEATEALIASFLDRFTWRKARRDHGGYDKTCP